MTDEQFEKCFNEINRRFDGVEKRLDDQERLHNRQIRLTGELKTAVATASAQLVGAGEAVHSLTQRIEQDADDAEEQSRKTGAYQNNLASTQEQLALWQLGNAKLTRVLLITGIIGTLVTGAMSILAFLKWYVHI